MIKDLLTKARSCRRYDATHALDESVLREMVDNTRFASSGANLQPLKYKLVCTQPMLDQIFAILKWGAALKDYSGPEPQERPTGYIIITADKSLAPNTAATEKDVGIAACVLALSAAERGLGTCMIAIFSHPKCKELLELGDGCEPMLVVAVGKPVEQIVLEDAQPGQPTTYYREGLVHHVPKRRLEDILL